MSFFSSMIVSVCVATGPGSYQSACSMAVDAGLQQTGVEKMAATFEKNTTKKAEDFAQATVPEPLKPAIGSFVFIAKTAIDKRLTVGLPTMGLCDKMTSELTPNSAMLSLRWGF